jgi:hypothetical protein
MDKIGEPAHSPALEHTMPQRKVIRLEFDQPIPDTHEWLYTVEACLDQIAGPGFEQVEWSDVESSVIGGRAFEFVYELVEVSSSDDPDPVLCVGDVSAREEEQAR